MTPFEAAKILWEYNNLDQPIQPADILVGLGSTDLSVAERASQLYLSGYASRLLFSGKSGRFSKNWQITEAQTYAYVAMSLGVSEDEILMETDSTNTGQNVQFTKELIQNQFPNVDSIIWVHKPYMERRTKATVEKIWPSSNSVITSPRITFEEYRLYEANDSKFFSRLAGETQRIMSYPSKGYITEQKIPSLVVRAFNELIQQKYTDYLIDS